MLHKTTESRFRRGKLFLLDVFKPIPFILNPPNPPPPPIHQFCASGIISFSRLIKGSTLSL